MAQWKIGAKLKEYRLQHDWTVTDVVNELQARYSLKISDKTIYGWESDQSFPRTQTFLALCELYQIDKPYEAFPIMPQQSADFAITQNERELLFQLRKHPELLGVINRVLDV